MGQRLPAGGMTVRSAGAAQPRLAAFAKFRVDARLLAADTRCYQELHAPVDDPAMAEHAIWSQTHGRSNLSDDLDRT